MVECQFRLLNLYAYFLSADLEAASGIASGLGLCFESWISEDPGMAVDARRRPLVVDRIEADSRHSIAMPTVLRLLYHLA